MVKITNVASIPQRSIFRYPGGKTWLIPVVRKWLKQNNQEKILIEPFVGGGIVSLTAVFENLVNRAIMVELDDEIASVWEVLLSERYNDLAYRILNFDLTIENVLNEFEKDNKTIEDTAFNTILKNRTFHGGIINKGSGFLKHGENGKGILSRWYPETLKRRILEIGQVRNKLEFLTDDAFNVIPRFLNDINAFHFVDPPYTKAGKRLYNLFEVDHERLFNLIGQITGHFLLTYDDTDYIRELAVRNNFEFRTIPMKTTLHFEKLELLISDNFTWMD